MKKKLIKLFDSIAASCIVYAICESIYSFYDSYKWKKEYKESLSKYDKESP